MSTSRNLVSVPGPGSCYSAWTVEWLLVKTNKPIRSARLLWGVFPPQDPVEAECCATFRKEKKNITQNIRRTKQTSESWVLTVEVTAAGKEGPRVFCLPPLLSSFAEALIEIMKKLRPPDFSLIPTQRREALSSQQGQFEMHPGTLTWPRLLSAGPQICLDCLVSLACNSSSELLFRNGEIKKKSWIIIIFLEEYLRSSLCQADKSVPHCVLLPPPVNQVLTWADEMDSPAVCLNQSGYYANMPVLETTVKNWNGWQS